MKSIFAHDHIFLNDGSNYYSKSGIPETVLCRYAVAFDSVDVVCRSLQVESTDLIPILDSRIRFYPQQNLRALSGIIGFAQVRREIARLVGLADVVVARLPSLLGWMAAREARLQGIPYAVEVVGNAYEANILHGSRLGRFVARAEHWLTAYEVLQAKNVIYITEHYLQGIYPTKGRAFVCPNVRVEPVQERMLDQRLIRIKRSEKRKIGLVGSLDVNYKGHRVALEVLKVLRDYYGVVNVEIEFAGGGDQVRWRDIAKELGVSEQVTFKGSIPPGEMVMEWLDSIDMLLQPSKTEGQGRAILEGMSRGCPVVASNVGGIPELLSSAMMTYSDDVSGMARRCVDILTKGEAYAEQSRRNWGVAHRFRPSLIERVRDEAFNCLRLDAELGKEVSMSNIDKPLS